MNRDIEGAGVLDAPQHEDLGADGGHLEHLLEGDVVELLRVRHDPGVGGVDAVDVGVDLADIGLERRGERDGGGVRPTASQGGDVLGLPVHTLEAGDEADLALVEGLADPARGDVDDAGVAVPLRGDDAGLGAGEGLRLGTEGVDRHGDQRIGDALTGGEEHVHLTPRGNRVDLVGEVEQLIGGVTHRRADDDDVIARLLGLHDALGDTSDALGALQG